MLLLWLQLVLLLLSLCDVYNYGYSYSIWCIYIYTYIYAIKPKLHPVTKLTKAYVEYLGMTCCTYLRLQIRPRISPWYLCVPNWKDLTTSSETEYLRHFSCPIAIVNRSKPSKPFWKLVAFASSPHLKPKGSGARNRWSRNLRENTQN